MCSNELLDSVRAKFKSLRSSIIASSKPWTPWALAALLDIDDSKLSIPAEMVVYKALRRGNALIGDEVVQVSFMIICVCWSCLCVGHACVLVLPVCWPCVCVGLACMLYVGHACVLVLPVCWPCVCVGDSCVFPYHYLCLSCA